MNKLAIAFVVSICLASPLLAKTYNGKVHRAGAQSTVTPLIKPLTGDAKVVHLLNRVTFGIKPGDIEAVKAMGIDAYIDQQLAPEKIPESPQVVAFVQESPAFSMTPFQLYKEYGPPAQNELKQQMNTASDPEDKAELKKKIGGFYKKLGDDVCRAKILRAVESQKQLQEVMTEFWFNHFNVSINKGVDHLWIGSYEEQAIRPYALGRFRDLLGATCYHPAMLFYLDNSKNKALPPSPDKKADGSNENYARELLELHTLGVDGGYTQKDVTELARVLTGLGLANKPPKRQMADWNGATNVIFSEKIHDFGDKEVVGNVIKGTGQNEVEQALDILARHPSTAKHISYQLAQYFVADDPPPALVGRMARTFTESDGNIREVLKTMLKSPEFWDVRNADNKYKNPFRYLVSTLRAVDSEPKNMNQTLNFLRQQGMPLYACLTPDGYKNTQVAWLNPDALLRRINLATAISMHQMPLVSSENDNFDSVYKAVGEELSDKTLQVVKDAPDQMKVAIMLGSPEFMKY
jgi:uncharacterized protein (DUF1800 family)